MIEGLEHLLYYILVMPMFIYSFWLMRTDLKEDYRYRLSCHVIFVAFFCFSIPAPYIYSGAAFEGGAFFQGFKLEVYSIYIFFALSINLAFCFTVISERAKVGVILRVPCRDPWPILFLVAFLTFIFIFSVGIENLPNYSFFNDKYASAYEKKQSLSQSGSFLLSKFQILLIPLVLYITIWYLMAFKATGWSLWVFLCVIVSLLLLIFYGTVRLSRGGLVYYFLSIYLAFIFQSKGRLSIMPLLGILLAACAMFYGLSSGGSSLFEVLSRLVQRVVMQHGFVYIHLDISKEIPFLNSFNAPVFSEIFSNYYFNVSKIAYDLYYEKNYSGSTAGMAFAQMYFSFGLLSFFIWTLLMWVFFYIDGVFYRSARDGDNQFGMVAFYYTFYALYLLPVLTNVFSVFSFSLVFSLSFWILLVFVFLILRARLYRVSRL